MTWLNKILSRIQAAKDAETAFQLGNVDVDLVKTADVLYQVPVFLVPGKWVTADGKIGIVTDTSSGNVIGVDHVDADGFTTIRKYYPVGQVLIAKLLEIPAPRRPSNNSQAHSLGYY